MIVAVKCVIGEPIYKSCKRIDIKNYRPVHLTSVACKNMKYLVSAYF